MLVNDGAPESEEALDVWPEVRLGAFVMVFEAAAEVGVADADADEDAETDEGLDADPDPDPEADTEADGAEEAEFTVEGESVLDCPIDPRTLLRLSDATTVVGWAELAALDMSLPGSDS